ncbi:MAG: GntR family transcriptional regulator, partial [Thermus sp.]
MPSFARPKQLREAVYEHLKALLLSGAYPPGARLSEVALAEALGASRTPIREAFQRLAKEGLLEL